MSLYQQALDRLAPAARVAVTDAFRTWSGDVAFAQVSRNVAAETAIVLEAFAAFLDSFATHLANGDAPDRCWITACRGHNLKGRQVPVADCPVALGRVRSLDDHAKSVAKASSGGLTQQEAKKQLLKHSGSLDPLGFEPFLRGAPLGNYYVWATFNPGDSSVDPFDRLPKSHFGICTALGLGGQTLNETLIVLVWNHVDTGSPALHRPTVADAGDYPYYRPRADADALWGLTEPLSPNPDALEPQPEIIMREATSQGLALPFRIISA